MNREETFWGSYDGREILVKDLKVRHLVNILNHIIKSNKTDPTSYSFAVFQLIEAEAALRIIGGFAENRAIPRKLPNGTYVLTNQTTAEKAIEDAKTATHNQKLAEKYAKMLN